MLAGAEDPAPSSLNASEGQNQPQFTLFSFLPTEIRLKIWQHSFLPRRVGLMRHQNKPALDCRSGALLLVNREANQVFLENYALCFVEGGSGVYFNYALDILRLNVELLEMLVDGYPGQMAKIQRLEISSYVHRQERIPYKLNKMSSLRLIIVRYDWWINWRLLEHFEVERRLETIWDTLEGVRCSLRQMPPNKRPTLSAILSPMAIEPSQLSAICATTVRDDETGFLSFKEPSCKTQDSFEVHIPEEWLAIWPGRGQLNKNGWFAYEVE